MDQLVSTLGQLTLLHKNKVIPNPVRITNKIQMPNVVYFTGHMIDNQRAESRFPLSLEGLVRKAVDQYLERINANIGFCSAACGGDILFIEAMLDRGAEINIILPFDLDDFIQTSVVHAGPGWVTRFKRAIRLADSIKYITRESYMGDDSLFDFAGEVILGYTHLRSAYLYKKPYLLALADPRSQARVGGTLQIIQKWPDPEYCRVIDITTLGSKDGKTNRKKNFDPMIQTTARNHIFQYKREIYAMLFADIVGFSKLNEKDYVPFHRFMNHVADRLNQLRSQPVFINTWGDGLFAVMDKAVELMEFAFCLKDAVKTGDFQTFGLPTKMDIRIALHSGPVFEIRDPITKRKNLYGSHVNRAARLEPVTLSGHVYACEQYVAQLISEQIDRQYKDNIKQCRFVLEYIGAMALHKDFGTQSVYHLREKTAHESRLYPNTFFC